jgi:hypothetical protein
MKENMIVDKLINGLLKAKDEGILKGDEELEFYDEFGKGEFIEINLFVKDSNPDPVRVYFTEDIDTVGDEIVIAES